MFKNLSAQVLLSLIVTFGFFFCIYRLQNTEVPASNRDLFNIMLGSLGTVWIKCIGFFFDSSSSSKTKDEIIGNMAQTSPVNINTTDKVSGNINIVDSKLKNDSMVDEQPTKKE